MLSSLIYCVGLGMWVFLEDAHLNSWIHGCSFFPFSLCVSLPLRPFSFFGFLHLIHHIQWPEHLFQFKCFYIETRHLHLCKLAYAAFIQSGYNSYTCLFSLLSLQMASKVTETVRLENIIACFSVPLHSGTPLVLLFEFESIYSI